MSKFIIAASMALLLYADWKVALGVFGVMTGIALEIEKRLSK